MTASRHLNSYTQGYALCTAGGSLLGHTYRRTADEAVEAVFPTDNPASAALWAERQALGWSVEEVYARVFTPRFFKDGEPSPVESEVAA